MTEFHGVSYEAHAEKDVKDFSTVDWVVFGIGGLLIIGAILAGFGNKWGGMMIIIGMFFAWIELLLRVVFHIKNIAGKIFLATGFVIIIPGVLWCIGGGGWAALSGFALLGGIWIVIGAVLIVAGIKNINKTRRCSLEINAECTVVDSKTNTIFKFDQVRTVNDLDTVFKNVLHFFINGNEYFVDADEYFENEDMEFENGKCVRIYVNPNNPNEVLPKRVTIGLFMAMGIGGLVGGIATLIIFIALFMLGLFDSFL